MAFGQKCSTKKNTCEPMRSSNNREGLQFLLPRRGHISQIELRWPLTLDPVVLSVARILWAHIKTFYTQFRLQSPGKQWQPPLQAWIIMHLGVYAMFNFQLEQRALCSHKFLGRATNDLFNFSSHTLTYISLDRACSIRTTHEGWVALLEIRG